MNCQEPYYNPTDTVLVIVNRLSIYIVDGRRCQIKVLGEGVIQKNMSKDCPKSSKMYMIKNLFSNLKLFMECKNNPVSQFCGRFRTDGYAPKTGFSFYKIGGENEWQRRNFQRLQICAHIRIENTHRNAALV